MAEKGTSKHGGARPGAGRPKGSENTPPTPLPRSLRRPENLSTFRGRDVPTGAQPDLYEQINWARSQIARCAAGEFSHRRAPTILKAAIALLDEALGKLREKHDIAGRLDLGAAVDRAFAAATTSPTVPARAAVAVLPASYVPAPVDLDDEDDDVPPLRPSDVDPGRGPELGSVPCPAAWRGPRPSDCEPDES